MRALFAVFFMIALVIACLAGLFTPHREYFMGLLSGLAVMAVYAWICNDFVSKL